MNKLLGVNVLVATVAADAIAADDASGVRMSLPEGRTVPDLHHPHRLTIPPHSVFRSNGNYVGRVGVRVIGSGGVSVGYDESVSASGNNNNISSVCGSVTSSVLSRFTFPVRHIVQMRQPASQPTSQPVTNQAS